MSNTQSLSLVQQFQNVQLILTTNAQHGFLMTTEQVAKGYGVSVDAVHSHKNSNSDEIIENKHFLSLVQIVVENGMKVIKTFWTKQGVIRLGMFIKSPQAVKFRKWARSVRLMKVACKPQLKRDRTYDLIIKEITENWDKFDDCGRGVMHACLREYISSVQNHYIKFVARRPNP